MPSFKLVADKPSTTVPGRRFYAVHCEQCGAFIGGAGEAAGLHVMPKLTVDQVAERILKFSPPRHDTVDAVRQHTC